MRELKFRTPTKCQNGHFRWFYYSVSFGETSVKWGNKHSDCTCSTWDFKDGFQECGEDQQFTGFKTEDKVEIFDGDILDGDFPDEVFWDKDRGQWMLRNNDGPDDTLWEILRDNKPKIIGNKYENQELLEKT